MMMMNPLCFVIGLPYIIPTYSWYRLGVLQQEDLRLPVRLQRTVCWLLPRAQDKNPATTCTYAVRSWGVSEGAMYVESWRKNSLSFSFVDRWGGGQLCFCFAHLFLDPRANVYSPRCCCCYCRQGRNTNSTFALLGSNVPVFLPLLIS